MSAGLVDECYRRAQEARRSAEMASMSSQKTSAANRGASIFKMRAVSRHKSIDVLSSYVRDADAFTDHARAGLL